MCFEHLDSSCPPFAVLISDVIRSIRKLLDCVHIKVVEWVFPHLLMLPVAFSRFLNQKKKESTGFVWIVLLLSFNNVVVEYLTIQTVGKINIRV